MADHPPTGPVEMGASMDYAEHERTYGLFLTLAKYASLVCVALLSAMAESWSWASWAVRIRCAALIG